MKNTTAADAKCGIVFSRGPTPSEERGKNEEESVSTASRFPVAKHKHKTYRKIPMRAQAAGGLPVCDWYQRTNSRKDLNKLATLLIDRRSGERKREGERGGGGGGKGAKADALRPVYMRATSVPLSKCYWEMK